jgi:hypothetical protein
MLYAANPITCDFENDGQFEVAVTPWYDLWMLDLATGRDRAVLCAGNTLFAIDTTPDLKPGVVRWSLSFPGRLGAAAIADPAGQGVAEIVVVCSDGNVSGVGDPAHAAPASPKVP